MGTAEHKGERLPTLLATLLPGCSSACRRALAWSRAVLSSEVAPAVLPTNAQDSGQRAGSPSHASHMQPLGAGRHSPKPKQHEPR